MTAPVRTRGWLRRNVWGLILVLPLAAGLFAVVGASRLYKDNYTYQPKRPVPIDGTGLATLDDYQLRMIELKPVENDIEVKELLGFNGQPLPDSVRIWRLMVSIRVDGPLDGSYVQNCRATLEDGAGHRFRPGPTELHGVSGLIGNCSPDDEDQPMPFTATTYYLLPVDARPASVIITWDDRLPRYVRFSVLP